MKKITSLFVLFFLLLFLYITAFAADSENPRLLTENVTVASGETAYYTTDGEVDYSIKVEDGGTLVLVDAQIKCTTDNPIQFLGNGTLQLVGESSVISGIGEYAAINAVAGGLLTIEDYTGDSEIGSLTVTGGLYAAGIGANAYEDVGAIVINSGIINATGGSNAAAIGSGLTYKSGEYLPSSPSITINDGTITANGGYYSAGIGSGRGNSYNLTVEINGGDITSTGGEKGPGIGGGYLAGGSAHTTININGGDITAVGKADGAGIGTSYTSNYTFYLLINITGGNINSRCINTSTGLFGNAIAAGIGTGSAYTANNTGSRIINISGGKIYALAGLTGFNEGGAGIGGGDTSSIDAINITGGLIYARGYKYTANDIGSGYGAQHIGTRTISGNSIVFLYGENTYTAYVNTIQAPNHTRYTGSFSDVLTDNNIYEIDSYFFACRYLYIPNTDIPETPANNVGGNVYDYYGDSLSGVTISLDTYSTTSGADGSFSISNIDMVDYTLSIKDGEALLNQYAYNYSSSYSNGLVIDDINSILEAKIFDDYDVNLYIQLSLDGTSAKVVSEVEYQIIYHDSLNAENTNPTSYALSYGTVQIAGLSKTGYTFKGWYDNAAFTGDAITEIAEKPAGKIDLYAKWEANTYIVVFDSNGGTGEMADQAFEYGVSQNLSSNTFEKERYTFAGWAASSAGEAIYSDEQEGCYLVSDGSEELTLYAVWDEIPVAGISFDNANVLINSSQTYLLTDVCPYTISPSNATDQKVTWESSDASVASINSSEGTITANSNGTVTITISAQDTSSGSTHSATCEVTVETPVSSISLNNAQKTIEQGDTYQLDATVNPDDSSRPEVTWSSDDISVATVTSNGLVTAVGKGEATITAAADSKSATCAISVKISVDNVTLDRTTKYLNQGQSFTLIASVGPGDATYPALTWSSGNGAVAIVTQAGFVKALDEGTATITATADGVSATCIVKVEIPVIGVSLSSEYERMYIGDTVTLAATVNPGDATNQNVTWESSDIDVATVSSDGTVKAIGIGGAIISATVEGNGAECSISVSIEPEPTATLTPEPTQIKPTSTPEPKVITIEIEPDIVNINKQTGEITVNININNLPEGTDSIKLPSGEIISVIDIADGELIIKIDEGDIDEEGYLQIVLLDGSQGAFGYAGIKISNNGEASGQSAWFLWIVGAIGALLIAASGVLYTMQKRKKNQRKKRR